MLDVSLMPIGDIQSLDLEELMNQDPRLLRAFACRPDASPVVLARLACHSNADVRLEVARNPHTPAEILSMLSEDTDGTDNCGNPVLHTACVQAVAANTSTPASVLARLVDVGSTGHVNALKNPHTPLVSIIKYIMKTVEAQEKDSINFNPQFSKLIKTAEKMDAEYETTTGQGISQETADCSVEYLG